MEKIHLLMLCALAALVTVSDGGRAASIYSGGLRLGSGSSSTSIFGSPGRNSYSGGVGRPVGSSVIGLSGSSMLGGGVGGASGYQVGNTIGNDHSKDDGDRYNGEANSDYRACYYSDDLDKKYGWRCPISQVCCESNCCETA